MCVCLWVLVEVFRSCEALLVDRVCRADAQRVLGEKLLATSAVGSDINNVDLVALIKVIGSPSLAIVWRVQPFCARIDTRRDEDHRVRLVGLASGRQLLDIQLVAPHLLARDAGVDVTATDVEEVSLVCRFLAATSWADAFDTSAVGCCWVILC